jgi:hypothetical protein
MEKTFTRQAYYLSPMNAHASQQPELSKVAVWRALI